MGGSAPLVSITGLSSSGEGVGRLEDGRVVFVEGALPGERVELIVLDEQKRFVRASVAQIVEASRDRVSPECAHFAKCGGCQWQHLRYSGQLAAKATIIRDALERIGGFESDQLKSVEVVPSPNPFGYRARARWVESDSGLGYRGKASREVVPVKACPVLVPSAEEALGRQNLRLQEAAQREASESSEADALSAPKTKRGQRRRPAPKEWVVTAGSEGAALVEPVTKGRRKDAQSDSVAIHVAGERLRVGSQSFVQGNSLLWDVFAKAVVAACMAGVRESERMRFVELYSGGGFFTLPLARAGASGCALESDASAIADLKVNLRSAGLDDRVEVVSGRVEGRKDLARRITDSDCLLVDPPRTGLEEKVCATIVRVGPPRFVYVSCDPATLARDLKRLVAGGYEIVSLEGYDLFPQTPHVETVVQLQRTAPIPSR